MLNQPTLQTLRTLKLFGMADALERQLQQPEVQTLAFEDRLGLLVEHEQTYRENRRLTRLLQLAKLKVPACVEDIDYRPARGLKRAQLAPLLSGEWLHTHQNLCLVGASGTGKPSPVYYPYNRNLMLRDDRHSC